jgi:hypothetical protein
MSELEKSPHSSVSFVRLFAQQTLREGQQLGFRPVGPPGYSTVFKKSQHDTMGRAAERLDAITRAPIRRLPEGIHNVHHILSVENACDIARHGGCNLATTTSREFCEDYVGQGSTNVSKGVAVKEKERGTTVTAAKKFYRLVEGLDLLAPNFPFLSDRRMTLRILAVLRASSRARSLVEADDKVATPVFEKLGSGL